MSSIDPQQARILDRFYESYLRPLSETPRDAAVAQTWPPRDSGSSYFVERERTQLGRQDFELRLGDQHRAASTLERAWAGTRLRSLAKPLMKLAPAFRDIEERSEISSLVYEMF
jgi:hypothetical protein